MDTCMPGEDDSAQDSIDLTINALTTEQTTTSAVANSSCSGACCGGPSCNSAPTPDPN